MAEQATQNAAPVQNMPSPAEKHITLNATFLFIIGGLTLLFGFIAFIATMAAGAFVDEYSSEAGYWTRFGGVIALVFMAFAGLPAVIAGIGVSKRQEWGRILALVVAGIQFVTLLFGNVAALLGAAYGVYAFVTLLRSDVAELFRAQAPA